MFNQEVNANFAKAGQSVSVGKSWYFAIMALVIKILPIFIQIITGVLILLL